MRARTIGLILLAFLLTVPILACGNIGGGSDGGDSGSSGGGDGSAPLDLLPDDVSRLEVLAVNAIVGGGVPETFESWFESEWEPYALGDDILTGDDIDMLVRATTKDGQILLMRGGQIDFPGIQSWLADEETNIEETPYQGQDIWGNENKAMVILEGDGYVAYGDSDAIKELLKVKARGTGSLAKASDNSLKTVYENARSGWYVMATDDCDRLLPDLELRSCRGFSITAGQGEEDYLVDLSYRFLFRSESRAESQAEDIEDYLDDTRWDIDLEEVKADGITVEARAFADEEDFRLNWLIDFSGISRPDPLPTAAPESTETPRSNREPTPTSRSQREATVAPAPAAKASTREATAVRAAQTARTIRLADCHSEINSEGIVRGVWSSGCPSAHKLGSYAYYYTFTLKGGGYVGIELISDYGENEYLFLLEGQGDQGRVIAENDDSDYSSGSLITTHLEAGIYTVEATTYHKGMSGDFEFSLYIT